ncbi:hypothetical protein AWC38_SpisGene23867 [Stylophora pistillata]|uniref:Uncharacterized protein n=1 Tax=Stylophora pistillata TaxID=50429 RepID=A0A2B4R7G6_STYPI|nr:hypothetical protein AWC38_SpisGene23867 [Stylophora pistillata]
MAGGSGLRTTVSRKRPASPVPVSAPSKSAAVSPKSDLINGGPDVLCEVPELAACSADHRAILCEIAVDARKPLDQRKRFCRWTSDARFIGLRDEDFKTAMEFCRKKFPNLQEVLRLGFDHYKERAQARVALSKVPYRVFRGFSNYLYDLFRKHLVLVSSRTFLITPTFLTHSLRTSSCESVVMANISVLNSIIPLQVWSALRLIVDSGLHYQGFSRRKALKFFADYAWDKSGGALREVTRYQSAPGQATAYMIGQQHIKKLREYAKNNLKDKFNLRDFHYHLLSQGSSPLRYLEESIETYVKCVKNEDAAGCYEILNPAMKDPAADVNYNVGDDLYEPIRRRHYF